jgi:hypothetical protein
VQAVEQQDALNAFVICRHLEDRADGTVARTPGRQRHRTEGHSRPGLGFFQQLGKSLGVGKRTCIGGGAGTELHGDHRGLAVAGSGHLGQPIAPVKMDEQRNLALGLQDGRHKQGPQRQLFAPPGWAFLGQARMRTGVLDHRRRVLARRRGAVLVGFRLPGNHRFLTGQGMTCEDA